MLRNDKSADDYDSDEDLFSTPTRRSDYEDIQEIADTTGEETLEIKVEQHEKKLAAKIALFSEKDIALLIVLEKKIAAAEFQESFNADKIIARIAALGLFVSALTLLLTNTLYSNDEKIVHGSLLYPNTSTTGIFAVDFFINFVMLMTMAVYPLHASNSAKEILSPEDIQDIENVTAIDVSAWSLKRTSNFLKDKREFNATWIAKQSSDINIYQFLNNAEARLTASVRHSPLTHISVNVLYVSALASTIASIIDNDYRLHDHEGGMKISAFNLLTSGLLLLDAARIVTLNRYRNKKVSDLFAPKEIEALKSILTEATISNDSARDSLWKVRFSQALPLRHVVMPTELGSETELQVIATKLKK